LFTIMYITSLMEVINFDLSDPPYTGRQVPLMECDPSPKEHRSTSRTSYRSCSKLRTPDYQAERIMYTKRYDVIVAGCNMRRPSCWTEGPTMQVKRVPLQEVFTAHVTPLLFSNAILNSGNSRKFLLAQAVRLSVAHVCYVRLENKVTSIPEHFCFLLCQRNSLPLVTSVVHVSKVTQACG
jgi:hypothetical protein